MIVALGVLAFLALIIFGAYHCCDDLTDCHECKDCGGMFDEDRDNCLHCGSKNIVEF
jgi:hypothetical protein